MIMSLSDGVDTITFSPLADSNYGVPEDRVRNQYISPNGNLMINEISENALYEISLNAVSKHDRDHIYTWWSDMIILHFVPDTTAPGTIIHIRIINESDPLPHMAGVAWQGFFEGTLELHEVPALS